MKILVTGGAGFIGSHTVDLLLQKGHAVRVLDALTPPVHKPGQRPDYVPGEVEFIQGDVRDREAWECALVGVEAVFHLAAYQDYLPDFSKFFHVLPGLQRGRGAGVGGARVRRPHGRCRPARPGAGHPRRIPLRRHPPHPLRYFQTPRAGLDAPGPPTQSAREHIEWAQSQPDFGNYTEAARAHMRQVGAKGCGTLSAAFPRTCGVDHGLH